MSLPFNLQKLPPEALDVLRYLGQHSSASVDELHQGTGIAARSIGKAIRRLVNYDYILLAGDGTYQLTTDGTMAVQQIAAADAAAPDTAAGPPRQDTPPVERHLTVVTPRSLVAGRPSDLYIGVNPPTGEERLPGTARLELKVSAVGGALSASNLSLDVPPDSAAKPGRLRLTPDGAQAGRIVRVRVDAFQAFEFDNLEALGGMYFDVPVVKDAAAKDTSTRAVGMDVRLKAPR